MTIGDTLGRLAAPPTAAPFEAFRLTLVDRLFGGTAGTSPTHGTWSRAFEEAADGVAHQIEAEAERMVRAAAAHSRMPASRLQKFLPGPAYAEMLTNRLLAAGIPLERLEQGGTDPLTDRSRGVAVDGAWDEAMRLAAAEMERWRGTMIQVREWRRPVTLLWVGSAIFMAAVITVAAWLGGVAPAPGWFDPVAAAFWAMPWW